MRVSDDRYSRDRLRLDLALRFIHLEARTQSIRTWTGLTDDRIRKLFRSYIREPRRISRPRGRSPQQAMFFMRSPRLQQETAVLASLCCLLGVLPRRASAQSAAQPGVAQGVVLCQAYEAYRALVPQGHISFEHAIFLVRALGSGEELAVGSCAGCAALVVVERMLLSEPRCRDCASTPMIYIASRHRSRLAAEVSGPR